MEECRISIARAIAVEFELLVNAHAGKVSSENADVSRVRYVVPRPESGRCDEPCLMSAPRSTLKHVRDSQREHHFTGRPAVSHAVIPPCTFATGQRPARSRRLALIALLLPEPQMTATSPLDGTSASRAGRTG